MSDQLIDLSDVTFLIPFKKDSDERLRNINVIIKYLTKYFKTNISIIENDINQNFLLDGLDISPSKINYEFRKSDNYIFHRTKLLNDMAKNCKTSIISLYDTDVIFKIKQYINTVELLRSGTFDVVFPYDGRFINYDGNILNQILNTLDVETIEESQGGCYNPNSVGGSIFFNKHKFIEYGMENENFISWGFEDTCRAVRIQKLSLKCARVSGILYHLNHPTSVNSSNTKHKAYYDNYYEYQKVLSMSTEQLKQYIKTWNWIPK